MSIATSTSPIRPEPELLGQTVVVIRGSAGIGLETARRARAEGAKLILAARDPERLEQVSRELGPLISTAFAATNFDQLKKFFDGLPTPVEAHLLLPLEVARCASKKVRNP
jgi:NADP-dependent 3-hydroxy acid dehydrogenase YdfG